jgi:uncharacterized membrane protein
MPVSAVFPHDLVFAARLLRKNPGFTLVAAISLALTIGANATIFSVAKQLLFERLDVPDAANLRLEHRLAGADANPYLVVAWVLAGIHHGLTRELEPEARNFLVGTAIVIFAFRAIPGPGAGDTWWVIDVLGFDQQFLASLELISSTLTLLSLFIFRRFMAENSIAYVVGALTVLGALLSLPTLGMYYGLHEWTAAHTNGVVDARFIALVDTALESPLGQIAMIPMLAWIANSAPEKLKVIFTSAMRTHAVPCPGALSR